MSPTEKLRDRAIGALVGLAVGDAIGTTLEFRERDTYPILTDMVGGGPFGLRPGQWTDDTSMALALADALLFNARLDEKDLMDRFCGWWRHGEYSCTGDCFDIGNTTRQALLTYEKTGEPLAGDRDPSAAGNGSLMRLAPVAIRYWGDQPTRAEIAARQSMTTHGAEEAVQACVAFSDLLSDAIGGAPFERVFEPRSGSWPHAVSKVMSMAGLRRPRQDVRSTGYVIHSLDAALWSVADADDFREAVLTAANLGGDADTTAAIAGQLAGAIWGISGIPEPWLERLAWCDDIVAAAGRLFEASLSANEDRKPASGQN